MYRDIISYKLANGISEEQLLIVAGKIIQTWMSKQRGFIKWEINKDGNGDYIDIVYWESREDAKKSELDMVNIPNANDWYACYQEGSISSKNISQIAIFNKNE